MRFYNVDSGLISLDVFLSVITPDPLIVSSSVWSCKRLGSDGDYHDNIAFGRPDASREDHCSCQGGNAHFFIQQLPQGYDTYLADAGDSLSQGQRQLLTIARVFLSVPKILILDEATSSIDTRTEVLIQEAFSKLMVGRTSFISPIACPLFKMLHHPRHGRW